MDRRGEKIMRKTVGDGVTAVFDTETGTLELHAQEGTLWPGWLERAGIKRNQIRSICVADGTHRMSQT